MSTGYQPLKAAQRTRLRRQSFDSVSGLYERYRPGYPEMLFDDLTRASGIPDSGRILEIGSGTGQATLPLARRGYSILALEPGKNLAQRCRRNCRPFPQVEIRCTTFEQWDLVPAAFDLVLAASSFHWIPYRIAFPKCVKALKSGGRLCLVWNFEDSPGPDTPQGRLYEELHNVYARFAPHLDKRRTPEERIERQRKKIVGSGLFAPPTALRYPWQCRYGAGEYTRLLRTMSDHALLAPEVRGPLLRAIHRLIIRHGGVFVRHLVSVLFVTAPRK